MTQLLAGMPPAAMFRFFVATSFGPSGEL